MSRPTASSFSRYRILGLVGQGQFGQVFCAMHRKTGKLFALKNLERERFPTHQFLRELRFLLSLQHTNIVTCHAIEHTATGRYLVMDYCESGTLRSLMADDLALPIAQSLRLVADVLQGLDCAHRQKIVHCDVKPENILLTLTAKGWLAKISDFGIARLSQEVYNRSAGNTGSPAYMAPERFYSRYSPASDLYAVGVLLFELLVGRRPFSGLPKALMMAHLNQTVQCPDSIPAGLQQVITTALEKLPARRFQSAMEMLEQINAAVKGTPY
ncbi:MAG: serine/threonine protein kinase [Symploca sp. SIO2B6]|nr:serine/threonine protein kinase [Symploca sp. SIO2B6]